MLQARDEGEEPAKCDTTTLLAEPRPVIQEVPRLHILLTVLAEEVAEGLIRGDDVVRQGLEARLGPGGVLREVVLHMVADLVESPVLFVGSEREVHAHHH